MKPVLTEDSNTRLILPEEEDRADDQRRGDVPVERCFLVDPETGEQRPGFKSTWLPEPGERKAIANGAPVALNLWGTAHPPVSMEVGDPDADSLEALVTVEEARRAASKFFERLSVRMEEDTEIGTKEIPAMFNLALQQVLHARKEEGGGNGSGPG